MTLTWWCESHLNSSPPMVAYIRQWTNAGLLSIGLLGTISMKFKSEFYHFHSTKSTWLSSAKMAAILSRGRWVKNASGFKLHLISLPPQGSYFPDRSAESRGSGRLLIWFAYRSRIWQWHKYRQILWQRCHGLQSPLEYRPLPSDLHIRQEHRADGFHFVLYNSNIRWVM